MFAAALSYAGYEALRRGVNYAGEVAGGAYGLGLMRNTVTNFTNMGQNIAGPIGGAVGKLVGQGAAGLAVNEAAKQAQSVSAAIGTLGNIGVDLAQNHMANKKLESKVTTLDEALETANNAAKVSEGLTVKAKQTEGNKTDWANVALQTGKAALVLGSAAALMATGAGVLVPLAAAAATSVPGVINALIDTAPKASEVDFVGDVVAPVTTQLAIGALGTLAGGIATHNAIEGAYDARVALGQRIGNGIDSFMPNAVKGLFGAAGKVVGTIDANRVAMAPETVKRAIQVGTNTKQAVETGLQLTNAVVQNQVAASNEEATTWADTARKAAWIGGGIAAGSLFTALAPQAATIAGGAALINAAPQATRYMKAKLFGSEAGVAKAADQKIAEQEVDLDDFVILEKEEAEQTTVAQDQELTKSKIESSIDLSTLFSSVSEEAKDEFLSKSWVMVPRAAEAA